MEYVTDLIDCQEATPVAAIGWANEVATKTRVPADRVPFQKTRSTIVLNAQDLSAQRNGHVANAIGHLLKTCAILGRSEIVVEHLEDLTPTDDIRSVLDSFNAIQSAAVKASRKSNMGATRIALEKHGQHHDVRIYLNLH